MAEIYALVAGTLYGLLIGIIPSAGATTGLVAVFGFIHLFGADPYLGVIFCMATVAASTTGDTYTGVLLGIPGANSSAATMVDGFPLAQQGKATYAITAAVTTSTLNGLLWGTLTFALLPWYTNLIMILGVPELWAFTMLALATVGFVSSRWWVRSLIAIAIGIGLGFVGTDPITNADRYTLGWQYLGEGLQIMPVMAGLFAIPELLEGLKRNRTSDIVSDQFSQTIDGIQAVWHCRWDAIRGGFIGAFIGLLPGLGGAMADWMSYGSTVAANPKEEFGKGNIRGVIGPEGANNAQKATSMIPTVLFGIPGAPFAAVIMALFMYLGFELGTPDLAYDTRFFDSLTFGFMWATAIVGVLCLVFTRYISLITQVPYKYYFPLLLAFITWACVQYTGGWEDYAILILCSILGIACKRYKFSRPGMVIGFILADRVEALSLQMNSLYTIDALLTRPIFITITLLTLGVFVWGIASKRRRLDYA
jgi:putative tricarboxylic transport membrane protein|tara:strand:- start:838 stop:2274 length:1437 start_codon:yes stop_codon:yes gene_type:complete